MSNFYLCRYNQLCPLCEPRCLCTSTYLLGGHAVFNMLSELCHSASKYHVKFLLSFLSNRCTERKMICPAGSRFMVTFSSGFEKFSPMQLSFEHDIILLVGAFILYPTLILFLDPLLFSIVIKELPQWCEIRRRTFLPEKSLSENKHSIAKIGTTNVLNIFSHLFAA